MIKFIEVKKYSQTKTKTKNKFPNLTISNKIKKPAKKNISEPKLD